MSFTLARLFQVDRRIIFIAVFLTILVPMLFPFSLPIRTTRHTRAVFDAIEQAASRGRPVIMSFDFDPTGAAEQDPMARAAVRHLFARGGKLVALGGNLSGQDLHERLLADCAQEYGAIAGVNYVYMPFKPGAGGMLVINMAQDFASAYPEAREYPLTRDLVSLRDFDYALVFATGLGYVVNWINYAQGPCGLKLGAALPGQMAPDVYNYVNSGQLTGLMGGLVGAAEYEQLLQDNGLGLPRRFSTTDLPAPAMRRVALALTRPDRPLLMRWIWERLPPEVCAALQQTLDNGFDRTTVGHKRVLAAALNDLAGRSDVISDGELASLSMTTATASLLATNPDVKLHAGAIRRRLFIERAFDGALLSVLDEGQATLWMTPQSIAHFTLVGALLLANASFLWDLWRKRKGVAA